MSNWSDAEDLIDKFAQVDGVHEPIVGWGWDKSKPLGEGGFGHVYEAYGPEPGRLAAKIVPKAAGATREQLIAQDVPGSPHVVPILGTAARIGDI